MKKYIQSMMAFAAIVSFASCSSEDNTTIENESAVKLMTFTATQEGDEQSTRATISTADSKVINWETGDKITLFDGTTKSDLTLKSGEDSPNATFTGEAIQSGSYTAVYPSQANASLSGNDVTSVTLPATQYARDNSFDKNAALMIAQSNSTTLGFKNVVGYVKVKPTFNCKRIDLKAFDNSAVLAGTGTVSYNNGEPTLDLSNAPTKDYAITLKGDIKANNYYYIAVPPVTLKAGWTIKFTVSNGTVYSRKGTNPITFTRNKVTNLGEFDINETSWYEPRGEVDANKEVDLGLTIKIGTKDYKVIFAKSNLTTGGLATNEYDYGDYFAWGATEPWCTAYNHTTTSASPTKWENSKNFTTYNWSTVPFRNGINDNCEKYTSELYTLEATDNAANKILGGDWQLPTADIWVALNNTSSYDWNWTNKEGYKGIEVKNKTDNTKSLFLPAAGCAVGNNIYSVSEKAYYWSGSVHTNTGALYLYFDETTVRPMDSHYRYHGFLVRPVRLVAE